MHTPGRYGLVLFLYLASFGCAYGNDVIPVGSWRSAARAVHHTPLVSRRGRQLSQSPVGTKGALIASRRSVIHLIGHPDAIASVVRGDPSWVTTLNTALRSKGNAALLWSTDPTNQLYRVRTLLHRCMYTTITGHDQCRV